jgi:ABC-2 type transport system ATP-binding protein
MSIIEVKKLSKTYDYYKKSPGLKASLKSLFRREKLFTEAVKEINFRIKEGEIVGFLGPNGAGKTTTLKMLSGILHPSSGEVNVLGHQPWKREAVFQKQFALVMGQKSQLSFDLPAADSFILQKEIYEVSDADYEKRMAELVELLDLKNLLDVQVRKLSLGERMKCELLMALIHNPKVLFLDEPTIGLDVVAQKNVRDFIKKYNALNKTTIILTSHYMADIKELCQRVVLIDHGVIAYDGLLSELITQYAPHKDIKVIFADGEITEAVLTDFGTVLEFSAHSAVVRVGREQAKEVAAKLLSSNLPVEDIEIKEEDIGAVISEVFKNK